MDVTITLDRTRTLRYTTRAMRLVEHRSGHTLGDLVVTRVGVESAAWLLWGALIHADQAFKNREEPELTIDDVCDLLDDEWFAKDKVLKELWPLFMAAAIEAGFFGKAAKTLAGKDSPETGSGSPGSGDSDSGTSAPPPGSSA